MHYFSFSAKEQVPLIYCYTRDRIPSQDTMNNITQEILRSGLNPNYLMKIDQTKTFDSAFTFDKTYYESTVISTSTTSTTRSVVSTSNLPSICPKDWDVKTFDSQYVSIYE